ncbi:hypothetical protein SCANM63S_05022 [Streptomyces canarius]
MGPADVARSVRKPTPTTSTGEGAHGSGVPHRGPGRCASRVGPPRPAARRGAGVLAAGGRHRCGWLMCGGCRGTGIRATRTRLWLKQSVRWEWERRYGCGPWSFTPWGPHSSLSIWTRCCAPAQAGQVRPERGAQPAVVQVGDQVRFARRIVHRGRAGLRRGGAEARTVTTAPAVTSAPAVTTVQAVIAVQARGPVARDRRSVALDTPVAGRGHPVRVRGAGHRHVRPPQHQVGRVPPVAGLRYVRLVAEHLRGGDRQIRVPVVERHHRRADQRHEPGARRVRGHRHRRDRGETGDSVRPVLLQGVHMSRRGKLQRLVPGDAHDPELVC